MLATMRAHAGPWFVLDHVRPFPGVTLERLIRQIRRGVLTAVTIVRGPTTYHQWRFAGETPVLSKYLGSCWSCQATVTADQHTCPICRAELDGGFSPSYARTGAAGQTDGRQTPPELAKLSEAVARAGRRHPGWQTATPRIGVFRVSWIIAAILVVVVVLVSVLVHFRSASTRPGAAAPSVSVARQMSDTT